LYSAYQYFFKNEYFIFAVHDNKMVKKNFHFTYALNKITSQITKNFNGNIENIFQVSLYFLAH